MEINISTVIFLSLLDNGVNMISKRRVYVVYFRFSLQLIVFLSVFLSEY